MAVAMTRGDASRKWHSQIAPDISVCAPPPVANCHLNSSECLFTAMGAKLSERADSDVDVQPCFATVLGFPRDPKGSLTRPFAGRPA